MTLAEIVEKQHDGDAFRDVVMAALATVETLAPEEVAAARAALERGVDWLDERDDLEAHAEAAPAGSLASSIRWMTWCCIGYDDEGSPALWAGCDHAEDLVVAAGATREEATARLAEVARQAGQRGS